MNDTLWEGAEICYYIDGKGYSFSLSDMQFAIVARILGLNVNEDCTEINHYSDETLKQFVTMRGNPLRLKPVDNINPFNEQEDKK